MYYTIYEYLIFVLECTKVVNSKILVLITYLCNKSRQFWILIELLITTEEFPPNVKILLLLGKGSLHS
jgi:hypothetical protein